MVTDFTAIVTEFFLNFRIFYFILVNSQDFWGKKKHPLNPYASEMSFLTRQIKY